MTLMRDGGDVLLHDVRLVGLYTLLGQRGALGWEGVRGRVRRFEGVDDEDVFGPDVLMVGEVVDRARKILVYNSAARDLVLTRRPDRADDVHVVPFAHPAPAPDPRPAPTCPRFATFGHLKDVEWLLGKIGPALRSVPDAQLTFVGPEPVPGDLATAVDTTRRTGLSHKVTFTGWVDDRSYRKYLSESTAAIQIRRIDQGETSAAVADCLAAGLPTIANEVGGIRDLPHDVVARVHSDPAPAELTAHLSRLARDEDRWRSLAGNGLSYAASHGATAAALAIVECIGDRG
jgi:glycosyltransferase involved in cell wall biosynthesis